MRSEAAREFIGWIRQGRRRGDGEDDRVRPGRHTKRVPVVTDRHTPVGTGRGGAGAHVLAGSDPGFDAPGGLAGGDGAGVGPSGGSAASPRERARGEGPGGATEGVEATDGGAS